MQNLTWFRHVSTIVNITIKKGHYGLLLESGIQTGFGYHGVVCTSMTTIRFSYDDQYESKLYTRKQ